MTTRRLAAILAADVVGFSSMMERDEEGTANWIRALRSEVVEPSVAKHSGRLIKTTGDGFLVEFASPVEAVRSALVIQEQLASGDYGAMQLRIGINLGDIIVEPDGDVLGDGVNVAARLEQIADPGGVAISGWVHDQIVGKIDRSFQDRGEQQIKNIARPVRVYTLVGGVHLAGQLTATKSLPLPDKPSIAVLPFTNMSGDPEQEYFADGMVEDIITALSRVKWFFVIARNSSFTYKGKAVDIRQVGRELGVHYVLEGSVRKAGTRVRITGQLIEAATGRHVWADRFDDSLVDIFDLQDRVTENVVGAIEPRLLQAEVERARSKPTKNLDAYDLYLKALPHFHDMTCEGTEESIRLLHKALELDPAYSVARALLARCYNRLVMYMWGSEEAHKHAIFHAKAALAHGRDDPRALHLSALVLATQGHVAVGKDAIERSITQNPNSSQAFGDRGWIHITLREPERAIQDFQRAMRLSPLDPHAFYHFSGFAWAHFQAQEYEEALNWAQRSVESGPHWLMGERMLIASMVMVGRDNDAKQLTADYLRRLPGASLASMRLRMLRWFGHPDEFVERYLDAFRKAGLPE
jgi:adenylate cyclase